jgi:two-component system nitrogen regulation sensor histidine kinase GlnL
MGQRAFKLGKAKILQGNEIDADAVLNALSTVVVVVDGELTIIRINNAGEQLFQSSAAHLKGQTLDRLIPADSPLFALIRQARDRGHSVAEYHLNLVSPRIGRHVANVQVTPLAEVPGTVVVSMQERTVATNIDRQLTHRGAARSVSAMAAMLAHEVKNPLSGIRGAAQLLEENLDPADRALTRLIRDEADRVCSLVDRMEGFSTSEALQREAVNIYEVLGRVHALAQNSFGRHLRFVENYDPSLPPAFANRDQLVQVFLNLVKNAAEAAPAEGGEVVISTAYLHGVRFAVSRNQSRVHLPLMISIKDNGEGIPDDIKAHLFEPFVTAKPNGTGLGLALVAKTIEDHGGVIEFESQPRSTLFRVMLPMYVAPEEVA